MSFRLRIIIAISVVIAISFGIGGTFLITVSFNNSLKEETEYAIKSYENVKNTLSLINSLGEDTAQTKLAEVLVQMESQGVGAWQAISLSEGDKIMYISGDKALRDYNETTAEANKCIYMYADDKYGRGIIISGIVISGDTPIILKLRFDVSSVYSSRENNNKLFGRIYLCVVLFGIIVAFALSFLMTSRLRKLTKAVRKIAGGDISYRSDLQSKDEFGQLSRDIDIMAEKLESNINKLETDMERQEAFMGAFAHELKTPMASIIGYADLLRQDVLDDNSRLIAANYIFTEGKRLDKLSFKLLDILLLKKDSINPKTVNISVFLKGIENALSPFLIEKNIKLVCRGERGKAFFDIDLVKSLLYNLIDNASKSIDGEGVIAVKGSLFNGGCCFEIIDNGCGMKNSELAKITEAFYRVDKSRSRRLGGAGLGLSLCKQIAELHDGQIAFESEVGVGTKVTVTLYGGNN